MGMLRQLSTALAQWEAHTNKRDPQPGDDEERARAIFRIIRKPDAAMIDAGFRAVSASGTIESIFTAMCDAAIRDGK